MTENALGAENIPFSSLAGLIIIWTLDRLTGENKFCAHQEPHEEEAPQQSGNWGLYTILNEEDNRDLGSERQKETEKLGVWLTNVCHAMQTSLSDMKIYFW